jgi:hypothetical protein
VPERVSAVSRDAGADCEVARAEAEAAVTDETPAVRIAIVAATLAATAGGADTKAPVPPCAEEQPATATTNPMTAADGRALMRPLSSSRR